MERVFNKLVRDNIPSIIENNGEKAIYRVLSDDEYIVELLKKLKEEVGEVLDSTNRDERLEELADVFEVIKSIAEYDNSNIDEVIRIADNKREKRGGFSKKYFLEKTK